MKKVFIGLFVLGFANLCTAQSAGKKEEVKFTPPVLKKNKPIKKNKKAKFTPPVIVRDKAQ